jgi:iron(III) transport system ATP-binding protein
VAGIARLRRGRPEPAAGAPESAAGQPGRGSVVSLSQVSKAYQPHRHAPVHALDNVSFEVASGEFVTLLGPSGSGKTTLLRCIAGLEQPGGGTITIGGRVVSGPAAWVPPNKRDIGMVFQSYAVWPHMTVKGNVAYPLRGNAGRRGAGSLTKEQIERAVAGALESVGLDGYGERWAGQLSGGQQQRVALARALVSRPGLLLFDEPLSNLDAKLRTETRQEILSLADQFKFTSVYVTHDQEEALAMSDRIVVLRNGVIEQIGTPEEVFEQPATSFVARFMGNAITFDATVFSHAPDSMLCVTPAWQGESGNGSGNPVWGKSYGKHKPVTGDRVELVIKARDMRVVADETRVQGDETLIGGTVVRHSFIGRMWETVVRLPGGQVATVPSSVRPSTARGADILLAVPRARVMLFAQDSDAQISEETDVP